MSETIQSIKDKFQPYGMTLLVRPLLAAEKSKGGILIPEQCRNPLSQGEVLVVGTQASEEEWAGKTIMWEAHTEATIKVDDIDLKIVKVDNVIMVQRSS